MSSCALRIIQDDMVFRLNSMPYCLNRLSWRYRGRAYWYLLVMIWLSSVGVAILFGIGDTGSGAVFISVLISFFSHWRQLYFRRICSMTLSCAGINSSFSLLSSPIWCKSLPQQSQTLSASSISCTMVFLGRSAGKGLRFGFLRL